MTSVVIGGLPICIQSANGDFIAMLEKRYAGFVAEPDKSGIRLDVEVIASVGDSVDEVLQVRCANGRWIIERGDFTAQWDPASLRGSVRQTAYPYAIDSVMADNISARLSSVFGYFGRFVRRCSTRMVTPLSTVTLSRPTSSSRAMARSACLISASPNNWRAWSCRWTRP